MVPERSLTSSSQALLEALTSKSKALQTLNLEILDDIGKVSQELQHEITLAKHEAAAVEALEAAYRERTFLSFSFFSTLPFLYSM